MGLFPRNQSIISCHLQFTKSVLQPKHGFLIQYALVESFSVREILYWQ
jgi:hypothetical protein